MAGKTRMTSTAEVFEHHMTAFEEKDVSELMADYTDDSVMISNMGTFRGLDDIESVVEHFFEEFSQPGVEFTVDEQTIDGDVAFLAWHAETPDNVYEFAVDTYVIRDGTIEYQTFAAKVTPKD